MDDGVVVVKVPTDNHHIDVQSQPYKYDPWVNFRRYLRGPNETKTHHQKYHKLNKQYFIDFLSVHIPCLLLVLPGISSQITTCTEKDKTVSVLERAQKWKLVYLIPLENLIICVFGLLCCKAVNRNKMSLYCMNLEGTCQTQISVPRISPLFTWMMN